MVSTSGGVLVAGGFVLEGTVDAPSRKAHLYERANQRWVSLPDTPDGAIVLYGLAVGDVPYLVASSCSSGDKQGSLSECAGLLLLRLISDGSGWEAIEAPPELFSATQSVGAAGPVGDDQVGVTPAGDEETALVTFDISTGEWRAVNPPPDGKGPLIMCFSEGEVFARTTGDALNGTGLPTGKKYAFTAWGLDKDRWSGALEVDLGTVVAQEGVEASELCAGGAFMASNVSSGGDGVVLTKQSGHLVADHVVAPSPAKGPGIETPRAGILKDGALVTLQSGKLSQERPPPEFQTALLAGEYVRSSERGSLVDLLIVSSESGALRIVTFARGNNS